LDGFLGFKPNTLLLQGLLAKPTPGEAFWRHKLANQGSVSRAKPSLAGKLENAAVGALKKVGVNDKRAARLGSKAFAAVNDLTPVGNATMAADAGDSFASGSPLQGLGLSALAVLPGAAGRAGRGMFGAPIRAYHGGKPHGGDFRLDMAGTAAGSPAERAVWFTPSPQDANHYAAVANADAAQMGPWPGHGTFEGATIYPADIDAENFLRIRPERNPRNRDGAQFYNSTFFENILKKAQRQGRPGVIFEAVKEGTLPAADQIAVIRPSRINSPF
jgi:hypothetical protein